MHCEGEKKCDICPEQGRPYVIHIRILYLSERVEEHAI